MNVHPKRSARNVALAVLDLAIASFMIGLLVSVAIFFQGYLEIYPLYRNAFVGLCFLFGSLGVGLYIHAIVLVGDFAGKGMVIGDQRLAIALRGIVPAVSYATAAAIALVCLTASSTAIESLLHDIGPEFTNTILFVSFGSLGSLGIVIACHLVVTRRIVAGPVLPGVAEARRRARFHIPSTSAGIGKVQVAAMLLVIVGGATTYAISSWLSPEDCFSGNHGFSTPAYDLDLLQTSPHHDPWLDALSPDNKTLLVTLERGLWRMTTTQSQGGFPMKALLDGSEFYADRGERCPLHPGEFAIQGGTPLVASVYLAMYSVEPNPAYLAVATAAARALLAVQDLENGGFYYDGRLFPDGRGYQPHPFNSRRAAVFDDDTTQSALAFLLAMYDATGNLTYRTAAERGLDYLFDLEKPGGGWPQRSNYGADDYQSFVTLNDDCMQDIMNLMFKANDSLGDARYMQAAERGGQFLLRVQGNGAGSNALQSGAWAQQYKNDQPEWARVFEPKAMCSAQTARAIEMLMDLYLRTANETYLDAIPAAVAWLVDDNTTLVDEWENPGNIVWARLYELETNRLIVGNRNNQGNGVLYYYDYDPERDEGYSWIGNYGINATLNRYDYLIGTCNKNITQYVAWRDAAPPISSLWSGAVEANATIHSSGFWLDEQGSIDSGRFATNALRIISYLKSIA